MWNLKKELNTFILLGLSLYAVAQTPEDIVRLKTKFKGAELAYLEKNEVLYVETNAHGNLDMYSEVLERKAYLAETALTDNVENIYYTAFQQPDDINVYTYSPEKGKKDGYKKISSDAITDREVMVRGIFYDDMRSKNITFSSVGIGAITELGYKMTHSEPHLLPAFYFADNIPAEKVSYSVIASEDVEIEWRIHGKNTDKIRFVKTPLKKGDMKYEWTMDNVPAFSYESDAPGRSYTLPHIAVFVKSYKGAKDTRVNVLGDVSLLYGWCSSLLGKTNTKTQDGLKKLADSLTANEKTPLKKAEIIFNYVQRNTNYIAFEDGMGGFIPRDAVDVYKRKYGDCKDLANLLCLLLRFSGVEAYHTWIGTRSVPYTYTEMPTPLCDNHMIVTAFIDGKPIFLDATGSYLPFGLPSSMIQGKEALVGKSPAAYEVIKVPVIPAEQNLLSDTYELSMDDKVLNGIGHSTLSGYYKSRFDHTYDEKKNDYLVRFFEKASNNFNFKNVQLKGLFEPSENTTLVYSFSVNDYIRLSGNNTYINLNINRPFTDALIDTARVSPVEIDFLSVISDDVVLKLNEGQKVQYLPPNTSFENEVGSFSFEYTNDNNQVVLKRRIQIKTLLVSGNAVSVWNTFIKKLLKNYKETVQLST